MEEKYNESTLNRPGGLRPIDAPVVQVDIKSFIKQLKDEKAWEEKDRNAITVFKTDKLTTVLVGLHKEATMQTEHPQNILSIHMIKGRVKLFADNKTITVDDGQLAIVHANVPYKIEAVKKAFFLMHIIE